MFDNIHLSNIKKSSEMNDLELVEEIQKRYPTYQIPIFRPSFEKPHNIDFINGPCAVIDESENDYKIQADEVISDSTPINTRRAYTGDLIYWSQWYMVSVFSKNPHIKEVNDEDVILQFILEHLGDMPKDVEDELIRRRIKKHKGSHSLSTIRRRLTVFTAQYRSAGGKDPCDTPRIKKLLSSLEKKTTTKKSKAITKQVLENLISTCKTKSLLDIRDKALMMFGFSSGGRRRSEISEAIIENLEENSDGDFTYRIAKSKTDQSGKGLTVPIKGKSAQALREWLLVTGIKEGKIFRSVKKGGLKIGENITPVDINRIVKRRCKLSGYDEKMFSAHSLRSGFITEAGKQGCSLGDTMHLSGHKSVPVAMGYYQSGNVLNNKAANLVD